MLARLIQRNHDADGYLLVEPLNRLGLSTLCVFEFSVCIGLSPVARRLLLLRPSLGPGDTVSCVLFLEVARLGEVRVGGGGGDLEAPRLREHSDFWSVVCSHGEEL